MVVKLQKPILVTGLGVTALFGLGETFHSRFFHMGEWGILGAIAVGTGAWLMRPKSSSIDFSLPPSLTKETVDQAMTQTEAMINSLTSEVPEKEILPLREKITQINTEFTRESLQIAITGARKVGKTSLKQQLEAQKLGDNLTFVETPPLLTEIEADEQKAQDLALASDLVIFLVNGDLMDSEWRIIKQLTAAHQRIILLLNKQDQYQPEERAIVIQQLQQRVKSYIPSYEIIPVAAAPKEIIVRQHQVDGTIKEWTEKPNPEIKELTERIQYICQKEQDQLLWGSAWRKTMNVKQQGKAIYNQVRKQKALPVVEQYQWIAAAAAFANPVASLDLLATAAINAQMLVDLGTVYQQKFSLSQAQTAASTIGKLMVQLGIVELTTHAVGAFLKSHALTYVAGGTVQGISAAYLTRLAGLSLIEYFQEQEIVLDPEANLNVESLGQKLKQVFDDNQRMAFLQSFVKQAISRLSLDKTATTVS
ncbi:hypothetical protein C7H19_14310 [Aphanothece hegewaldii CCALA 016]|uniref:DUF697 domain-containing protein n=1 Tax=Aphanothece hegewaldii CCALA 016 TaxID=2107694 RepID=A0A2T1LW98_9CHRO|nr:DUF697 domain-containing protein [Aphanothece hegewaldii]PSF36166.1 hypothetical protein C7H19_14310 [Aphanothece hegewaldii CCALA 016]